MNSKLTEYQLSKLKPLELKLKRAVHSGDTDKAIELATQIQRLFPNEWRKHHRLLRAKLWAFESCLDANRISYAQRGFIGIRKLSASNTRLYLEASSLLAVCHLRSKDTSTAKTLIKEVIEKINNISSERTKHQFQKRLIERIEEECILTELIGTNDLAMNIEEIQAKAVLLIQRNSDTEIFQFIGNSIPTASIDLLRDVRAYSLNQLPPPDRKLLPSPDKAEEPQKIGKTAFGIIKRIAWKTFCNPDSTIYKLWKNRVPKVFNEGYFSAAVVTTMGDFKIGIPLLASGISALIMKYTAEEFCELSKPKGLMIDRGKE
ncbi:hypothetical protein [Amphritea pacifica]|uniref:Tetratricopeptide repeat protein n=1 Tax=Amphritea pacifica TaxID=2811233 RepID=A0ABS2W8W3_9GAMM|nr:hypothetical protein [Amphritea pacifica]MBN0988050.1 hypothetical protein [Amphritea pacifica]MBN1006695.1 hypothetical protein [Amphritea pacifica]